MLTKQDHIDNIMDNFGFSRVASAMQHLNWQWAYSDTGVPEEPELRKTVRNYLGQAYDYATAQGRKYTVATGGFVYGYDPQYGEMSLTFELAGWNSSLIDGSPF